MADPAPATSPVRGWLLPAAIVVAFALLGAWQANSVLEDRGAFDHDEVITHLAVSGHLDDWVGIQLGVPPRGTWAPAEDFRAVLELDDESSPAETRANLTELDLHPPLYFWAVYGARDVGGIGLFRSGPAVNVVALGLTVAVLFLVLAPLFERRWLAALTAGLCALSPAVAFASALARPYVLLALWVSALLWVTAHLLRRPRSRLILALLAGVTGVGLLTAYPFAYALAGALLVLVVQSVRRRSLAGLAGVAGAAVAGTVLFAVVHPGFGDQLDRADFALPGYSRDELPDRLSDVVEGFIDIVTLERWTDSVPAIVGAAVLVALLTAPWWGRRAVPIVRRSPELLAAVAIGGTSAALTVLAFAAGRTPVHAVGRQYVVMFVPPVVVLIGGFVARLRRPGVAVGLLACGLLAVSWQWQGEHRQRWAPQRTAVDAVRRGDAFVADCALRGFLPGVTMWARPDADVLLLPREGVPIPQPATALDPARTLFLHADPATCRAHRSVPGEEALAELGVAPGSRIGSIGAMDVGRVLPGTPGSGDPAEETSGSG